MMSWISRSVGTSGARTTSPGGDASGLLQTMQAHVDDVRSHLQCGICIRPLYEPFTIACGHTFCYSCLSAWFTSNQSCPDCRSPVKVQPAPAYLIRTLVQMFTSRPELLENGETTAEHLKHQREEAQRLERDKADTNPRTGGLFKGAFKPKPAIQQPVLDLEDNVLRCPECSWELEDDECVHCGYFAGDFDDLESMSGTGSRVGSDLEENSVMTDYIDDEPEGVFDPIDYTWNGTPIGAVTPAMSRSYFADQRHPYYPNIPPLELDEYDNEEDEDEDDYSDDADMDSFIDDDLIENEQDESESESDHSTVVGAHESSTQDHHDDLQPGTQESTSQVEDDNSEYYSGEDLSQSETNEEDEVDEDEDQVDEVDEEDEEDEEDQIQPPVTRRHQRYNNNALGNPRPYYVTNPFLLARQPQSNPGSTSLNAINIDDDDEDDEDDAPVAPVRRGRGGGWRGRINVRFSAY